MKLIHIAITTLLPLALSAQVVLVDPQPPFADGQWIGNRAGAYFFSDIEALHAGGSYEVVHAGDAQQGRFIFLQPKSALDIRFSVPVAGRFHLWVFTRQHGNSVPTAQVLLNGDRKGQIRGRGWRRVDLGSMEPGMHEVRFIEASPDSPDWPYSLFPLDVVGLTTDATWEPSTQLMEHPYDPDFGPWFPKPFAYMPRLVLDLAGQRVAFTAEAGWKPEDLLLIEAGGRSQATTPFTTKGQPFRRVTVGGLSMQEGAGYALEFPRARIAEVDRNVLTPNHDGVDDTVTMAVPNDLPGVIEVLDANASPILRLPDQTLTWDGMDEAGEPLPLGRYVLRFQSTPTPHALRQEEWVSVVHLDPTAEPLIQARVRQFSPNGDGVFDHAYVRLNLTPARGDTIGVRCERSGRVVRSDLTVDWGRSWHLQWDGLDGGGDLVVAGNYRIEVRTAGGELRAGTRVELIDREPSEYVPFPSDFFALGVWADVGDLADLKAHNVNLVYQGRNTGSRAMLDEAQNHGIRVMINLMEVVHRIIDREVVMSEPEMEAYLRAHLEPILGHPALAGYYLADEPGWDEERAYRFRAVQQVLGVVDPATPSMICFIGLDGRLQYPRATRVRHLLIDVYPKGVDDSGHFRRVFGYDMDMLEYVDRYLEQLDGRDVPLWLILQAHSFGDWHRQPSPEEIVCQAWLGLTRAPRGLIYFFYETQQVWQGLADLPEHFKALSGVYGELAQISDLLLQLERAENVATMQGGGNPHGYPSGTVATLSDGTHRYLIAVNRNVLEASEVRLESEQYPRSPLRNMITGETRQMGGRITLPPGGGAIFRIEHSR